MVVLQFLTLVSLYIIIISAGEGNRCLLYSLAKHSQTVIKVSKMFVMSDEGLVVRHMQDLLHVEGVYLCSFVKAPLRMKFQTNCLSLSFLPDFYLLSFDDQLSNLQVILAAQHSCGPLCSSSLPSLKS